LSVEVEDLWKKLGGIWVLRGVSFTVSRGELAVLLGPSGCGKTTTLKVVAGLLKPEKGSVLIGGEDVTDKPPRERGVGMVFQNLALFPHLTVRENIAYGLKARGWSGSEVEARVRELVEMLDLKGLEDRYPRQLSGGQQQRVALARALAPNPQLLLLDEPLTNLDASLREKLRWELRELQRKLGFTAIYVTHDQAEAMMLADRLLVMFEGSILREGRPEEVYRSPGASRVASFLGYNVLPLSKLSGELESVAPPWARYVAFSPDDVEVGELEGECLQLAGRVLAIAFQKTCYRLRVETEMGIVEAVTSRPPVSSKVLLRIPLDRVVLLAY